MQRYVGHVRAGMSYRMGVAIGGVEKLGALPLVLALYFQFKDVKSFDISLLLDMNAAAGTCLTQLVAIYILGYRFMIFKMQLDGYDRFLSESLVDEAPAGLTLNESG